LSTLTSEWLGLFEETGLSGELTALAEKYKKTSDTKDEAEEKAAQELTPQAVLKFYESNGITPTDDGIDKIPIAGAEDKIKKSSILKTKDPAADRVIGEGAVEADADAAPPKSKPAGKKNSIARDLKKDIKITKDGITLPDEIMRREANTVDVIEWVAKRLESPITEEIVAEAPCAEAVGMLRSYGTSDARKAEFWDKVYVKLIPNKTQLSNRQKVEFDGKEIVGNIDRILKGDFNG